MEHAGRVGEELALVQLHQVAGCRASHQFARAHRLATRFVSATAQAQRTGRDSRGERRHVIGAFMRAECHALGSQRLQDLHIGQRHRRMDHAAGGIAHENVDLLEFRRDLRREAAAVVDRQRVAIDLHQRLAALAVGDLRLLAIGHLAVDLDTPVLLAAGFRRIRRHRARLAIPAQHQPVLGNLLLIGKVRGGRLGARLRQREVQLRRPDRVGVAFDEHGLAGVTMDQLRDLGQRLTRIRAQHRVAALERLAGHGERDGRRAVDAERAHRARSANAIAIEQRQLVLVEFATTEARTVVLHAVPRDTARGLALTFKGALDVALRAHDGEGPRADKLGVVRRDLEAQRSRELPVLDLHRLRQPGDRQPNIAVRQRQQVTVEQQLWSLDGADEHGGLGRGLARDLEPRHGGLARAQGVANHLDAEVGLGQESRAHGDETRLLGGGMRHTRNARDIDLDHASARANAGDVVESVIVRERVGSIIERHLGARDAAFIATLAAIAIVIVEHAADDGAEAERFIDAHTHSCFARVRKQASVADIAGDGDVAVVRGGRAGTDDELVAQRHIAGLALVCLAIAVAVHEARHRTEYERQRP